MDWLHENWLLVACLAVSAAGVWWLLPQHENRPRAAGILFALLGCSMLGWILPMTVEPIDRQAMFWIFSMGAIVCGVLVITSRKPVYSALWFALVTFSTCGLFWLQSARFLAAATVIVYAGAIIVTFVFVIMLAQQAGSTGYDQWSRQPLAATVVSFVLLGALLSTLDKWGEAANAAGPAALPVAEANLLSQPGTDEAGNARPLGTMHGLGRSLFGDYLFAVEIAGTLLLVASIGAIAIAPRRSRGTL
jgi:NADH-quinone oxidoreductase subunit J